MQNPKLHFKASEATGRGAHKHFLLGDPFVLCIDTSNALVSVADEVRTERKVIIIVMILLYA